ncbi:hypothetical protein [Streptomyces globisporus]|uniref:hypothetical protein n=1 Tax=Streptomyces globisporus TaxID=1908 RepID=UPI0004C88F32|nr:hypothetical protein [Streptomyces globisporus]
MTYSYGGFYDLSDVGEECKPFPVPDGEPADLGFVRFTAKMLTESGLDEAHAYAARGLADQMVAGQVAFTLQRGDLPTVNQHRQVHGREALAGRQHDIAPEDHRLLLRLSLRDRTAAEPTAS